MRRRVLAAGATVVSLLAVLPVFGGNKLVTPPPGWEFISEVENDSAAHFINSASVNKQDSLVEVWQMINFSRPQQDSKEKTFHSTKHLALFDCKQRTFAVKEVIFYAGAKGSGEVIKSWSNETPKHNRVVPDTVSEGVLKAVCNKSEETTEITQEEINYLVTQAKNNNPYLVHWENNAPAAWDEALRQDRLLKTSPQWAGKSFDLRFKEVVRRVRAIMPDASEPPQRVSW